MVVDLPFGIWVKKRRKALDLTQTVLAGRVGCSMTLIVKIEAGERRPSNQIAELLAIALEVPVEEREAFLKFARERGDSTPLSGIQPLSIEAQLVNLPIPSTPLVGREREMVEVTSFLKKPDCRLLTIVGMGGIGKTRLAIEAGARVREEFPDGIYFIELAAVDTPDYLYSALLNAFHAKVDGGDDSKERLITLIGQKKQLLILDNFEQITEGSDLLTEILERVPNIKILTTSREPLNLRGEWLFEIKGLQFADSSEKGDFEASNAGSLFLQIAKRSHKKFKLEKDDKFVIEQICRMMEGVPLAIELAAAWTRTLSCSEIAREIEKDIDFLTSPMRDMPARHYSMRVVFDHSWHMLNGHEQSVLSKLSIFRGDFTRDAAERVAGATLPILSALVLKSLVRRTDHGRYGLHEVVRQYAFRQLETTGELEHTKRLHIAYYIEFAEAARLHLRTAKMAAWLDRYEQENDNLRAALDGVISLKDGRSALRFGRGMLLFWEHRGLITEGRRWLSAILELPVEESEENLLARAGTLSGAGLLARIQGDFGAAYSFHEGSLAIRRRFGDINGIATSLNSLGILNMFEGRYEQAENYFQESLEIYQELDDKKQVANKLNNLGVIAMCQGQYEKASSLYKSAIGINKEQDDQHAMAGSLGNLGDVLRLQGDYIHAMQVLDESLDLFRKMGDVYGSIITLNSIARVHNARGDTDRALHVFHSGMMLNRDVGDKTEIAIALEGIAEALGMHTESQPGSERNIRLAIRFLFASSRLRKDIRMPRSAAERVEFDRITNLLRAQITEVGFTTESDIGAAMTAEEAVASASLYLSERVSHNKGSSPTPES